VALELRTVSDCADAADETASKRTAMNDRMVRSL
jgi:hypothetical protein